MKKNAKYLSAPKRRALTVKAVLELAAEHSPSEITTAKIAAHMGISQAAVFRHFVTKDKVWEEVMTWVAQELLTRIKEAVASRNSPVQSLEAAFLTHVSFAAEYPGVPRILFAELQQARSTPAKKVARSLVQEYGRVLALIMERGKDLNEIDRSVSVEVAGPMFIGAVQGLIITSMLTGEPGSMIRNAPDTFSLFIRSLQHCSCGSDDGKSTSFTY